MRKESNKMDSDEMLAFDDTELEQQLSPYIVKYPSEFEINKTIDTLRKHVPTKQAKVSRGFQGLPRLILRMQSEVTIISKLYWLFGLALFIIGSILIKYSTIEALYILLVITPLPVLFGLFETFKGREQGVLELEMACKHSPSEIILARFLLVSAYNIGLNILLILGFSSYLQGINLFEILTLSFLTLICFTVILLAISMRFRGSVFIVLSLSVWIIYSLIIPPSLQWIEQFMQTNILLHLILITLGMIVIFIQLTRLWRNYRTYEGKDKVEISY